MGFRGAPSRLGVRRPCPRARGSCCRRPRPVASRRVRFPGGERFACASIRPGGDTPGRVWMGTFRLYTGPDGQGRIETIDIEKKTDWLKGLPTSQISFSVWPVGPLPRLASGAAPPVRDHPVGPARDRAGRRLQARVRSRRRPPGRGHHRPGPHHPGRQPGAGRDRDDSARPAVRRGPWPPRSCSRPSQPDVHPRDRPRADAGRLRAGGRRSRHAGVHPGRRRRRVLPGPGPPDGRRVLPLGARS